MKAGLVAKLAKQVAKFYEQAVNLTRDKEVTRCLDASWIHHMDFQRECFQGAAEYWQSHAVKEEALATGKGFGEEITRLTRAGTAVLLAVLLCCCGDKLHGTC